ncbi:hypothetical protein V501_02520 [Pseudogymnoascus sp. VKM F-4519 (FW-2642)]|nr:hypothetical protein V501_02520 [Pseudogymnoascus sp. VKM F-4519 (FW-2642)]
MKGASAVFAQHISEGEKVIVLTPQPPYKFHPSGLTNYQLIEAPILKGELGVHGLFRIDMVHLTVEGAENFKYQVWPVDQTHTWTAKFGLPVRTQHWRQVKGFTFPQSHTVDEDVMNQPSLSLYSNRRGSTQVVVQTSHDSQRMNLEHEEFKAENSLSQNHGFDRWQDSSRQKQVIFPNAPTISITVNGGARMPGWYDIRAINDSAADEDEAGIMRSCSTVHRLIDAEIAAGIPSERIVLGGFCQSAVLSILAGTTCKHKLGGIVGWSGYMLLKDKFKDLVRENNGNKDIEIFMGLADIDPLMLPEWGRWTAEKGLEHLAATKEIDDFEDYLHMWISDLEDEDPVQ